MLIINLNKKNKTQIIKIFILYKNQKRTMMGSLYKTSVRISNQIIQYPTSATRNYVSAHCGTLKNPTPQQKNNKTKNKNSLKFYTNNCILRKIIL